MGPLSLSVDNANSHAAVTYAQKNKFNNSKVKSPNRFASVSMEEEKPFNFIRVLIDGIIAGGIAGVVVETALYPIDTIKTRLQAARGGSKIKLKGLYAGLGGNLAGVLPASAIFVGVYEPTKQKLLKALPENLSAVAHLTAGAIARAASSLVRVPTEVVKQRMQTGQFASASNVVRLIVAKEGFKGLYAGYSSFLLRDLPFDAIQFCIYEQLRIGYKIAARRDLNGAETALIGAFSGAITGAVTAPLDVLKTRLMVQGAASQYNGLISCAQTIVREEGPAALLKVPYKRGKWILDSGCSKHMTGDKEMLSNIIYSDGGSVTFGDNSKGYVIGKGDVSNNGSSGGLGMDSLVCWLAWSRSDIGAGAIRFGV